MNTMRVQPGPGLAHAKMPASLRSKRAAAGLPRAAAETTPSSDPSSDNTAPTATKNGQPPTPRVHLIPQSKWSDGVPPVMGGHLMASGAVSPLSTSKQPGREDDAFMFYYPAPHSDRVCVMQYINAEAAAQGLADMLADASREAVAARGAFTIALSGGSLIAALKPLASCKDVDFSKWHVFFVDERNVAHDSPDSTYGAARDAFLERAGVPTSQVYAIKPGMSVEDAAIEYAGRMLGLDERVLPRTADDLPAIDAVLLGVGPDGHIGSLFPNRTQVGDASGRWVLPVANSPKPPSERITLSLPAINAARRVVFVATGMGKAEVVQRVLETQALPGALPAQMVRPSDGSVTWVLDAESAHALKVGQWEDSKSFPRSTVGSAKAAGKK